jgi:HAD superfamily hydrolase (TIGR01490 family)
VPGAAFFDLDRTLLSRSSSLALAGIFRRRRLIRRRQLVRAAFAQLFFARFGASEARVLRTAERAMGVLAGVEVAEVREIVEEAMEPVLKPLVYREALDLAASHAAAGESSYIVSAALEEIVQAVAAELGLAGAIGSRCGIVDGIYTGHVERALYGATKARAVEELAATNAIDLGASTAYSESSSRWGDPWPSTPTGHCDVLRFVEAGPCCASVRVRSSRHDVE